MIWKPHPGAQKEFFDGKLGVAAHAAMCADATLTPDQAVAVARHTMMELDDQIKLYAAAGGVDTVVVIGDAHIDEPCKYLGMDCGMRDVIVINCGDFVEPREEPVLDRHHFIGAKGPRALKKRDWEQRNKKQRRR